MRQWVGPYNSGAGPYNSGRGHKTEERGARSWIVFPLAELELISGMSSMEMHVLAFNLDFDLLEQTC